MLRNRASQVTIAISVCLAAWGLLALPDLFWEDGARVWDGMFTERNTLFYFCEPPLVDAFVRQPAGTYSNLGFLFAGMVMLIHGIRDGRAESELFVERHRTWSFMYAGALIGTFLGSAFFHASLTWIAEWVDLAAVFATAWLPVTFNAHRLFVHYRKKNSPTGPWVAGYLVILAVSCLSIFNLKAWYTFPIVIALILLTAVWLQTVAGSRRSLGWMTVSAVFIGLAIMWFVFDILRILCDPEVWLQPHALWHLSNAAAALAMYGFMRNLGES